MRQASVARHHLRRPSRPERSGLLPTVALLVLTILIGTVAVVASQRGASQRLEDTVLMQSRIDAIPLGARWSGIMRATLAPGAVWPQIQQGYEDVGAQVYQVETGTLTVHAEQPIQLIATGTSQPTTASANTPAVLQAGAYGFTPAGVLSEWRNEGPDPLSVLYVELAVVGWDTHTILPPGVTRTPVIEQRKTTEPHGPLMLTVRQVTLPPRATLPLDTIPGLELLAVISGQLQALDPPEANEAVNPLLLPQELTRRRLSTGTAAMGTFRPGRVVSNPGAEPTTLLLLTMTPAGS